MDNNISTPETTELSNRVIITINGQESVFTYDQLSINFNDSSESILRATQALINESITDEDNEFTYTVRKSSESQNIFIYPKPGAGINNIN